MAKKECELYPKVKGEDSVLYKKLLKMTKDRPITNYIYASYLQSGVGAQMDSQGLTRDSRGEHFAQDVYNFFEVDKLIRESIPVALNTLAGSFGTIDEHLNLVDFDSSEKALDIALQVNADSKGATALVIKHDDKFNVIIEKRDSRTIWRARAMTEAKQIWDVVKAAFADKGVDLSDEAIDQSFVNAIDSKNFVRWLSNIQRTRNNIIPKKEIYTLLSLNKDSSQVQRLITMFGNLDNAAQSIFDMYRGGSFPTGQKSLMDSTLTKCKELHNINITDLTESVKNIGEDVKSSLDGSIEQTLKELNDKYNISFNEIVLAGKEIKSLRDAASEAAVSLQRQLKQLQSTEGATERSEATERALNALMQEIENNKYRAGILGFLGEAEKQVSAIIDTLHAMPKSIDSLESVTQASKLLVEIKKIVDGYTTTLSALTKIDSLISEESISAADKSAIEEQAGRILSVFEENKSLINNLRDGVVTKMFTHILGDKLPNGLPLVTILEMSKADSSVFDFLYSGERMSNPLIAAMGTLIRQAQGSRDAAMNEVSLRIRRAENKLSQAGFSNDFMYETLGNEQFIISDIDWASYYKARAAFRRKMTKSGLKGVSLSLAMQDWEKDNTVDREVDNKTGRTERVPNESYRKEFPTLTPEQQEYYDEMMQIKGELGTMLPEYARHQYRPPQIRREFVDALEEATSASDYYAVLKDKFKGLYTIREDDTSNTINGIVEGETYNLTSGNLDNTPFRQIPIFFVNKLKDQSTLLHDFSGAIQHLAGTAINYQALNDIKDTVEVMGDFIKGQDVIATKNGIPLAENVSDSSVNIFKVLATAARNTNTSAIIDGLIEKHVYGVKLKDYGLKSKLLSKLLAYTSMRSLAVNVKGMISNYLVGEIQMLIEAGAGEFYNPIDYIWAHGKVFGDNTSGAVGRIMDFVSNNENSESVLLAKLFDPLNENFSEESNKRYYKGILRHMLGTDFTFMGYGAGEHMLHFTNMYAVLHNIKVRLEGKEVPLYDVFSVENKKDGNSELVIDPNATYVNDKGEEVPIDDAFLQKVRDRIRYVNQTTHGSMNEEDKGLIHQRMLGRFAMNLRQWMVEHYSRRFRAEHWDGALGEYREGYYRTALKFMYGWAGDIFNFQREGMLHWKEMTTAQKANFKRALTEQLILGCLYGLEFALGEPDAHKEEWWTRMWIYQVKRAIVDVHGSTPWGLVPEMNTLLQSPIAATNVVNTILYPIYGLPDIMDTIKSGPHEGENKYFRNLQKYTLPFYGQIEQMMDLGEDEGIFAIFNRRNMR